MRLVIDANIVFSSLVAGNIVDLIFSPKLELIAPELLFVEMRKHKSELMGKSEFSEPEFEILFSLLESRIKIIPLEEFIDLIPEAEKLLEKHIKDAPYLALALRFNCPFWSYEKRFKKIGKAESLNTKELVDLINI
ncbi:MAG: PIN domain-containing protein [Candidatus Diapherotrites archaeon]|nr:PIN domain-containing protein [Candidatus Diapherotrites archaeon]